MRQVQEAVYALTDMGVVVLSPADPRVVDQLDAFLFVASDRLRSVRLVQQRHLFAISESDFLWLVAPDGYVGTSATMEVGYAVACGVPVLSTSVPIDVTLREFVTVVPDMKSALVRTEPAEHDLAHLSLLDPVAAVEQAHRGLDDLQAALTGTGRPGSTQSWRDNVDGLIEVSKHL
jgi:hypothetical protein